MKKKHEWKTYAPEKGAYKILLIMKLSFLLTFLMLLQIQAAVYSQNSVFTISVENQEIRYVLKELEQKSDFRFFYSEDFQLLNKRVRLNASNASIQDVLDKLLEGSSLTYRIFSDNLVVIIPSDEIEQGTKVAGTVTDPSGTPLPGVNIVEVGTTNGAVTDLDGNYSITVSSEDAVLSFSFVGYLTEEIEVGGQTRIDIMLVEDVLALDEVVVIGYGSMRKSDLTGAISTVSSTSIEKQNTTNLSQALQGNVSGITVSNSHTPGSDSKIRIRGLSTINNNAPLWIVDGMPISGSGSQLNPSEIESITVLKDASSSAIYGARGANGVILVQTKSGGTNKPVQIDVSFHSGISYANDKLDVLNTSEYGEMLWLQYNNSGVSPSDRIYGSGASPDIPEYILPARAEPGSSGVDPALYDILFEHEDGDGIYQIVKSNPNGTDWYDKIYQNGLIQNYNISVTGGTDKTSAAFVAGFMEEEGILKYTGFSRYSLRSNLSSKIKDWLKIGQNIGVYSTDTEGLHSNNNEYSPISQAYTVPPYVPVYDIKGGFAGNTTTGGGDWHNPLADLYRSRNDLGNKLAVIGNIFTELIILQDIKFKTQLGFDYENFAGKYPRTQNYEQTKTNQYVQLTNRKSLLRRWNWINTVNYNKTFLNDHTLDLLLGTEAVDNKFRQSSASRSKFFSADEDYLYLNAGELEQTNSESGYAWSTFSYFGRLNYSIRDKYLLTATLRRDGSSRFGENNRYGMFPAVSGGWRLSEEPFLSSWSTFLDYLKIRAGWGLTGNDQIGNYNAFTVFNSSSVRAGYPLQGANNSSSNGFELSAFGNPDAKWETTTTTNIGLDATIYNKLDFSIDIWRKYTKDMLYRLQIPDVVGQASPPSVNIGEMSNKGIDFNLTYRGENGRQDFSYTLNLYLSHYQNEIQKISNMDDEFIIGPGTGHNFSYTRAEVGTSFPEFYGYIVDGIFQTDAEAEQHTPAFGTYNEAGHFKFRNINDDEVIDEEDRTYIGSPHPDLSGGLSANIIYKNFDLFVNFYGMYGNDIMNGTKRWLDFNTFVGNRSKARLYESWGSPYLDNNSSANMPKAELSDANSQLPSTYFLEDGSFLRLNNVQLGYSLPDKVNTKLGIRSLKVFISMKSLLTITGYSGLDPEITVSGDVNSGIDFGAWPTPKRIQLGVNVSL